ncbi:MAG: hypothetical protein HYT87_00650 [Nitrospirae bacterium]|nr:hypothetical protein [Nitrospirota bacterium]
MRIVFLLADSSGPFSETMLGSAQILTEAGLAEAVEIGYESSFKHPYYRSLEDPEEYRDALRRLEEADVLLCSPTLPENLPPFGPRKWSELLVGKRLGLCVIDYFDLTAQLISKEQAKEFVGRGGFVCQIHSSTPGIDLIDPARRLTYPILWPDPLRGRPDLQSLLDRSPNEGPVVIATIGLDPLRRGHWTLDGPIQRIQADGIAVDRTRLFGVPISKIFPQLLQCDLLFDRLTANHYLPTSTVYLTAFGRPMLMSHPSENLINIMKTQSADWHPWIAFEPGGLESVLRDLVRDARKREEIGRRTRKWFQDFVCGGAGMHAFVAGLGRMPVYEPR